MADQKLHLGMSPMTGKIYLGKQNNGLWVGQKRDVTSEFFDVVLQKFQPGNIQNISENGENKYKLLVVDIDTEVTVNGKKY